jgi:RNA polymerase sigma factor (sigma-70 family)
MLIPSSRSAATPVARLRGDEADLYRAHQPRLLRAVRASIRNAPSALIEDACANAWAIFLRRQPDRCETTFGWLYTVARREAFALLGAQTAARDPDAAAHAMDAIPAPLGVEHHAALRARLEDAAATLSPHQRQALGLHARGYSYAEIAAATGRTYTWVSRHIREGRQALRAAERISS